MVLLNSSTNACLTAMRSSMIGWHSKSAEAPAGQQCYLHGIVFKSIKAPEWASERVIRMGIPALS